MGLLSGMFSALLGDFSDGVTCPVCGGKCAWSGYDDAVWVCESCGYEVEGLQTEYDEETDSLRTLGIDWYCDECDAHLNAQSGFDPYDDRWICTECGHENGLTQDDM